MRDPVELIRLYCREDDAEAFREFYRAQAPRLWKYLVARGCAPEDAYDLLSETFTRFFQSICRDWHAPVAFLYRIVTNLRIDAWRRAQVSPVDPVADCEYAEKAADLTSDQAAHLRQLVTNLPPREQNLLRLRYWIGLSHKELALVLELPEGTARRQCTEAIAKLRQLWGQDDA